MRLHSLDYLRGLAAFGIMIFHYFTYTYGGFTADTLLCRIGTYGVGIFYILSGITLHHVYYHKLDSKESLIDFFIRRFFRIFPLLWLSTFATLLIRGVKPDPYMLFLNVTGLFGFVKWDAYWASGAWSIGNELVYYTVFPFLVFFSKSKPSLMIVLSLIITGFYLYFAFYKMQTGSDYFVNYINPLNNMFLFLGGFLIGLIFENIQVSKRTTITLFLLSFALFAGYPVDGERIKLLIGINRLFFTLFSLAICFSFYKSTILFPAILDKPLALLGEASYSVYLIHPIVFHLFERLHILKPAIIPISIGTTLLISYFIFKYFEKFFVSLGKRSRICD